MNFLTRLWQKISGAEQEARKAGQKISDFEQEAQKAAVDATTEAITEVALKTGIVEDP